MDRCNQSPAALRWLICAAAAPLMAGAALAQDQDADDGAGDDPAARTPAAAIDDAGNGHRGIFHFNQDASDGTQQANVAALAFVAAEGAAIADSAATQGSGATSLIAANAGLAADASMSRIANDAAGIIGMNQSAASGSQQINSAAIARTAGPGGLAMASAAATGNAAGTPIAALLPPGSSSASMDGVGNAASGIIQINQIAGLGGRQANLVAIAAAPGGAALAEVISEGDRPNAADAYSGAAGPVALINSFNAASGLVQINQASGSGNAQANLLAAAFGGFADAQVVSDAGLGQATGSPVESPLPEGEGRIALGSSFEGFSGVAQVSQVSGHGNQTTNTISASFGALAGGGAP
ncbi:hypothetical protein [Erythrobacter sp.]|uniref:hypothetical protein n=1 Tax=Erythrobacter sp. TaxID=1042 RepID=UPI0025F4805A|nr:hypothetical protein [Erythrobacter sp.]